MPKFQHAKSSKNELNFQHPLLPSQTNSIQLSSRSNMVLHSHPCVWVRLTLPIALYSRTKLTNTSHYLPIIGSGMNVWSSLKKWERVNHTSALCRSLKVTYLPFEHCNMGMWHVELSLPRVKARSSQRSNVYGRRRLPTLGKAELGKTVSLLTYFLPLYQVTWSQTMRLELSVSWTNRISNRWLDSKAWAFRHLQPKTSLLVIAQGILIYQKPKLILLVGLLSTQLWRLCSQGEGEGKKNHQEISF